MKTYDIRTDQGQVIGFEINNTFVGRWRACRAARDIPGSRIIRWPRRWALNDDEFCEFELNGSRFVIVEPFGDNSRYWIVSDPPAPEPVVAEVRASFAKAPAFDWRWRAAG
jgi:hypothetical protein